MKIEALSTGTVQIKTAMAIGRPPIRLVRALLDRNYTRALPIHAWVIHHPDGPVLVDTGELASSRDMPIAKFTVERDDEIDRQLGRLGIEPNDLQAVVLTHLHGDHMNGVARLGSVGVRVSADALTWFGRRMLARRGIEAAPLSLTDGPFGAFARSAKITADGSIVAVPVPGHATGQIAIAVVEDGRHVLIGGDSTYNQRQLIDGKVDGVAVSARDALASIRNILAHARRHPTVYLPSHDPESAARLADRTVLMAREA
jgi:glyoxylase-like metal-dependent hydrolase (beta-lactamase superfamily II)